MRVERDSLVDVTYDIEHAVQYSTACRPGTPPAAARRAASSQLDDPGTPAERRLPEGDDYGFLWRLNAYWRYVPVEGGVLVECESLALSRSVPSLLRPVAAPIIDKVSRESLENTLGALRAGLRETRGKNYTRRPVRACLVTSAASPARKSQLYQQLEGRQPAKSDLASTLLKHERQED